MQHLDRTDEETAALIQELHEIVENDRYPFSPRIRTLRAILAKLRPEPVRKPLPPLRDYAPPSTGRDRPRGSGCLNQPGHGPARKASAPGPPSTPARGQGTC